MTDREDGQDGAADVRRQFAALQAEMKRVMAEPPADADAADDLDRLEQGIEASRRAADRLRARLGDVAEAPATAAAIAALGARIEEIGRQAEDATDRLTRAVQGNREALTALSLRLDTLARRRRSGLAVPLSILLGAVVIAGAVLAGSPGALDRLVARAGTVIGAPWAHATPSGPPPAAE